ncbi:hypothetical protein [Nakamurella sp.]|uniref:hypothetical protein n=1 Tax=Nakamurella sp. TaxID=1869182 RepID=UPI003784BD81
MAAIDDLTELVERAAAAEKSALAAKWKDRGDVAATVRRVRKAAEDQREAIRLDGRGTDRLSPRWADLRQNYLDLGAQPEIAPTDEPGGDEVTHAAAAQAEADAIAAVGVARVALTDAALAVLQARLARIDAGEDAVDAAAIDGHVPLAGRNPVSRHGPALAGGLLGEIRYIVNRKPRNTMKSLAIALALGLLYLGWIRLFDWDQDKQWLPFLGLFVLSVVMGGAVCINALSFDAMRVRAALDTGQRLWHLLVIKNLALLCLVAPIGFVISALIAITSGDWSRFVNALVLTVCFILLWLGVGNVVSIAIPSRDEPILKRKQSGSLKQFLIAFAASYAVGYLVNIMLIWRAFAARDLAAKLGEQWLPLIFLVVSCVSMWILLTVFAVALSQQPKVRRLLQREIADYTNNAEARALEKEAAKEAASRTEREPAAT